jgi:hypothetical protein
MTMAAPFIKCAAASVYAYVPDSFIQHSMAPVAASPFHHHDPEIMTNYRPLFLMLGLLAAAPALCASNPKSYLDGHPQTKTDPLLYPVQIIAVDGIAQNGNPIHVTPGPHWLEVVGPKPAAAAAPKSQTFVLKIDPCTYYYVGAHKESAIQDKWKLVVDEEDTIKECNPAEEIKNAKAAQAQDLAKPVVPASH